MSDMFPSLTNEHIEFIRAQHMFFVATGCADGRINLSPKGLDTLRIDHPNRLLWLNLTGSGNETAAHVREDGRMTIMFCGFERQPLILRLYGRATVIHRQDSEWANTAARFNEHLGARQIFDMTIDSVQTSCGFAVPYYQFERERETLTKWAEKKGSDEIENYWHTRNDLSIDGKPTGMTAS